MDNTWFLQMTEARLIVDPWLEGTEVDYFSWFNTQWHRTPPMSYADVPAFDAVLITQKYPDHFHEKTLLRLQPSTVLAPAFLGSRLMRLLPQATLHLFDQETPSHTIGSVRISHLPTRRRLDPIYDAYFIEDDQESIMVANHGFDLDEDHRNQLGHDASCDVLISPFNRYSLPGFLGGLVSPGLEGLADLVEQTKPRRVVQTHDELKHSKGLVPALARIVAFDPEQVERHAWLQERYLPILDYTAVRL